MRLLYGCLMPTNEELRHFVLFSCRKPNPTGFRFRGNIRGVNKYSLQIKTVPHFFSPSLALQYNSKF